MNPTEEMPAEMQEMLEELKIQKLIRIETIGKSVAKKRDEAVTARKQSGIEDIWKEDEEYYLGVDDANRDSHPWTKSASNTGGISREPKKSSNRCTAFFNITRQFVESATARMGDILLPAGDWNFAIKPTPVQDDVMAPGPQPSNMGEEVVDPYSEDPAQVDAQRRAKKAELWIQDKLVECSYHSEVRKVISNSAKLGTGVIKGPFPEKQTVRKVTTVEGKTALEILSVTSPCSVNVDPRDAFPDPACGDNIQNGSYFVHRDRLTARQLKNLIGVDGYLEDQIERVIDEGPSKQNYDDGRRNDKHTGDVDKFEVWYFYGLLSKEDLCDLSVDVKDSKSDLINAIVTLVNERPIKAFINPLDSGEFPFDFMPWQPQPDCPWGIGISRQGRTAQDMLNSAGRAMMDNAGLSSGPMLIIRRNAIVPADGKWEVTARKVWWTSEQSDVKSVTDAFTAVNIPMIQADLSAIIQMAYKMMEDATGIFFLLQGQQGSAPDTVGGMELMHRNASALLRLMARLFDERVTEPHIRRYYEWLLIDGPDDAKGDMKIEAIGSTALVEREIQAMESMALLQLSLDPRFELDPAKAMIEVLKTKRFIPDKWTMDEQKKKSIQPQIIPAIEVAKIKSADLDKQLAQEKDIAIASQRLTTHKIDVDTDRDTRYAETMAQRDQTTATIRIQELQIKRDLAMLEYANRKDIALDQIKSELAKESMRLKTQRELAGLAAVENKHLRPEIAPTTKDVEPPPTQLPGRAPDGRAFEQV